MTRVPRDVPEAELAVLEVLWEGGAQTRRQIANVLYPGGEPAQYATIQKLLERLEKKGHVRRESSSTGLTFQAVLTRDDLISARLAEMVERLCGGSLTPVLHNLVRTQGITAEQLEELRSFVRKQRDASRRGPSTEGEK